MAKFEALIWIKVLVPLEEELDTPLEVIEAEQQITTVRDRGEIAVARLLHRQLEDAYLAKRTALAIKAEGEITEKLSKQLSYEVVGSYVEEVHEIRT